MHETLFSAFEKTERSSLYRTTSAVDEPQGLDALVYSSASSNIWLLPQRLPEDIAAGMCVVL